MSSTLQIHVDSEDIPLPPSRAYSQQLGSPTSFFSSSGVTPASYVADMIMSPIKEYTRFINSMEIFQPKFGKWTREEMIRLIIHDGHHLYNEELITEEFLRQLCTDLYAGKEAPEKPILLSDEEKDFLSKGVGKLQNIWIYKKCKFQNLVRRLQRIAKSAPSPYTEEQHYNFNGIEFNASLLRTLPMGDLRSSLEEREFRDIQTLNSVLDNPWTPPDWVSAKRSLDFVHPRRGGKGGSSFHTLSTTTGRHCTLGGFGEQCDLWSEGQVSEFSIYGPGITNYFKYLKWLFWISGILFVITLPMLVINTFGIFPDYAMLSDLSITTVGHLKNIGSNSTLAVQVPFCMTYTFDSGNVCIITRNQLGKLYMTINILVAISVLVGFIWLRYFEKTEESIQNKNTVCTSMFTIAVKNIPRYTDRKELWCHFEKVLRHEFPIVDIEFAYDNEDEIKVCEERGALIKEISRLIDFQRYQRTLIRRDPSITYDQAEEKIDQITKPFIEELNKLHRTLINYDKLLEKLEKTSNVTTAAYITFNDCVGAHVAVDLFKPSILDWCFNHSVLYFRGHRLKVRMAPEPSTIIWENLPVANSSRIPRKFLGVFISLALVCVSLMSAYSLRFLNQVYTNSDHPCAPNFYSLSSRQQQDIAQADSTQLHCYCDQFNAAFQQNNPICRSYFEREVSSQVFLFFAAAVVVIMNTLIEYVFTVCAVYERHQSEDSKERSIFWRLFLLKYLNTGLVFLITSDTSSVNSFISATYSINTSFTLSWYQTIGVTIILVQLSNVFTVHGPTFYSYLRYHYKLRQSKQESDRCLTQAELNELHMGPPMCISYRYAQTLSTFFTCLTFTSGIPLLQAFAFATFALFYWVEKHLFINFYRAPYRYSTVIGKTSTLFIPIAVAIHLAMSIWVLSNQTVFSSPSQSSSSNSNTVDSDSDSPTFPVFIFLIVLLVVIAYYIVYRTVLALLGQMWAWVGGREEHDKRIFQSKSKYKMKLGFAATVVGGFVRAVQRNLIKDLSSFSILKNPKYKQAFGISWEFAARHRKVSDVYRYSRLYTSKDLVLGLSPPSMGVNDDPIRAESFRRSGDCALQKEDILPPSPIESSKSIPVKSDSFFPKITLFQSSKSLNELNTSTLSPIADSCHPRPHSDPVCRFRPSQFNHASPNILNMKRRSPGDQDRASQSLWHQHELAMAQARTQFQTYVQTAQSETPIQRERSRSYNSLV